MGRKFLLVGLFVWQPTQGSVTQLAVGTIVAAVYLMIQLQARPYKHATDDYLATSSSFGLLMLFLCSIVFKVCHRMHRTGSALRSLPQVALTWSLVRSLPWDSCASTPRWSTCACATWRRASCTS